MLKAKVRKSLSVLLSATMLASMFTGFAAVASADDNDVAEQAVGVQTFTEDFSSYTADTVVTEKTQMNDNLAGTVAATHPSGAKWTVPKTQTARGVIDATMAGKYWFEVYSEKPVENVLKIQGMGNGYRAQLNLDTSDAFKVEKFKKFEITNIACGESIGTRLFVNEAENSYLEFSFTGERSSATESGKVPKQMPKVVYSKGGTRTILYNAGEEIVADGETTTRGKADGWKEGTDNGAGKHLKWTIVVNDDNSLTWTVTTIGDSVYKAGEATSTGTIPASIAAPLMADYAYPLAATGDGDNQYGKYSSVSFDYIPDTSTSLVEDFASYTADTVATENTTAANGDVIATHPSGSTWVVGKQVYGNNAVRSAYKFDVANDRLFLKGWGNSWNDLSVDLHLDSSIKIESIKRFKFTTYSNEEDLGVRLFTSSDHNTYIEFGMSGERRSSENAAKYPKYMPYVILNNNNTKTQKFSSGDAVGDTTQGLTDGWTAKRNSQYIAVDWTVDVNEDGSLSWSAVSSYAASSGTISADEAAPMMAKYSYPVTLVGYGDNINSAYGKVQIDYIPDASETFVEDFKSYTADSVIASSDYLSMTKDTAELTAAVHPSGARWRIPKTAVARGYIDEKMAGKFRIVPGYLYIKGMGGGMRGSLNLETDNLGIASVNEFTANVINFNEAGGIRIFVNEDEDTYLEFALAGNRSAGTESGTVPAYMPKVIACVDGTRTVLFNSGETVTGDDGNETTRGEADGWKATGADKRVTWTIKVNDDGSISWNVITNGTGGVYKYGDAESSGTIPAATAKSIIEEYKYPVAATGDGDDGNCTIIQNIKFKYTRDLTYKAPDFHEDFKDYKADDNTVTDVYYVRNGQKVLTTHASGAKWITSTKHTDLSNYAGAAYVDVTNNRLALKGWGTYHLQKVLLDYSDKKYDIDKVQFTSKLAQHDAGVTGVTMFVDSINENNYIFFGQVRENASVFGLSNGETSETKFKAYAPVIAKVVNGVATPLVYTKASDTDATAWSSNDSDVTWTIELDENNNIIWKAVSSKGTTASGTINDDEVKTIIEANWAYPLAAIGCGDAYGYINSVDMWTSEPYELTYEKKAYTRDEFKALFDSARYGKAADVEKLMKLDLSEIDGGTANATVTVGTSTKNVTSRIFGTHTEYSPEYKWIADENGNVSDEFKAAAQKISPIAVYRIGGGGSTPKNMLKDLKNENSYYLESEKLPSHMQEKAATVSHEHQTVDVATLINAALANNADAAFNLVISPYTTTPEEAVQLISILTGADSSYRLAYGLPEKPIKIEYIELGNELEHMNDYSKSKEFSTWYGDRIPAYISAIEAADPSIKIIANGMTCPWQGVGSYGFWLDMFAATRTVGTDTNYRLVDHIDAISFHPYYDWGNVGAPGLLGVMDAMKTYLDDKAPGNNVKFCITEHGIGWEQDGVFSNYETSSFKAALVNSAFVSMAASRDHVEPALFNHGTYGTLWERINDNMVSPLGEVYSFLSSEWKDTLLDTTVSIADGEDVVGSYKNYFTASTVKSSANEIKLILTNAADYRSVNTTFSLPGNYTLVNEKILTAPNPYTATYNKNCEDLLTKTDNDVEVENFSSYEVPASSIVVLTLQIPDGKSEFAENFDYSNNVVSASDTATTVVTNTNGAKWVTSATNNGMVEADYDIIFNDSYGTVEIANSALKISNAEVSEKATAANWDISGVTEKPSDISEISFTINGKNGGVKLFAGADESSKFDFSNKTVSLSGTVNWTITIADGTLTYSASSGATPVTGTMSITDADMTGYTYLVSAYLNSGVEDSATFDNFLFRYGSTAEPELNAVTVTNNTNTVDVTVNPSVLNKTSVRVLVGYYNGDALVGANTTVITADGQIFNSAKPSATYTKAKVFVWDSNSQTPLTDETEVN